MSVQAQQILDAVRGERQGMIDRLSALASIETSSLQPETQRPGFDLLASAFADIDYRTRFLRGNTSGGQLLALPRDRRRGRPSQLLLGHVDTVYDLGTLAEMPVEIRNDAGVPGIPGIQGTSIMRGPGVYDMKGGLVQALTALRVLRDLGLEPGVVPIMFVNSDEEIGSDDSQRRIVSLARRVERVFVMEPALGVDGHIKTARKGVAQYDVTVHGRAAHAGLNPEDGISAIREMARLVEQIFELHGGSGVDAVQVNVGQITGGTRPNVIAPRCGIVVDVRAPTAKHADAVEEALAGLRTEHPEARIEVACTHRRSPMEPTEAGRALWRSARNLAGDLGIHIEEGTAGGGSDGNITNLYAPTLDGLGMVGGGAHACNEFIDLDRMIERTALLALLLLEPSSTPA